MSCSSTRAMLCILARGISVRNVGALAAQHDGITAFEGLEGAESCEPAKNTGRRNHELEILHRSDSIDVRRHRNNDDASQRGS